MSQEIGKDGYTWIRFFRKKGHKSGTLWPSLSKFHLDSLKSVGGVWDTTLNKQTNHLTDRLLTPVYPTLISLVWGIKYHTIYKFKSLTTCNNWAWLPYSPMDSWSWDSENLVRFSCISTVPSSNSPGAVWYFTRRLLWSWSLVNT